MGKKQSEKFDYFPHILKQSNTIEELEKLYGNDGYAVWFKLLEILGVSPDYQYEISNQILYKNLMNKFKISDERFEQIINTLYELNAIDKESWNKNILFVPNLVTNIQQTKKKINNKTNLVDESKKKFLEYVFLTDEELEKLIKKFGIELTEDKIEALNNWIGENPTEKKRQKTSHYYTLLNWDRMAKQKGNQVKKPAYRDMSTYNFD